MKKLSYLLSFAMLCGVGALSTSCKKEGCTDDSATNYSKKAKVDDGTCTYSAAYYNDETNDKMQGTWTVTSHKDSGFELIGTAIIKESYVITKADASGGSMVQNYQDANQVNHSFSGTYSIFESGKKLMYEDDEYVLTFQSNNQVTMTYTYINGETVIVMHK